MDTKVSIAVPTAVPYNVIPSNHPARTLVLCFDGTGDSFDADNSNVVNFFSALQKNDMNEQMVYYQSGIGTYTVPQITSPLRAKLSKIIDMIVAWNMDAHVMEGYRFLMENYIVGDKICLFGFSRGAYTARALAGMIYKVGLLPAGNHQQVPFAFKLLTRTDEEGWGQSTIFKKAFCIDVDIEFIGVWDTVSSVGSPHRVPFTASNFIKTFRHAISLDERRAKFKPLPYNRSTPQELRLGTQPGEMPRPMTVVPTDISSPEAVSGVSSEEMLEGMVNAKGKGTPKRRSTECEASDAATSETAGPPRVLEVWFAGCHCDVGGGSVGNESRNNLARIPLRWMIRQCFLTNTGIRFHKPLLVALGLDPDSLYPVVKPRPPPTYYTPSESSLVSDASSSMKKRLIDVIKAFVDFAKNIAGGGKEKDRSTTTMTRVGYGNVVLGSIRSEEEEELRDALDPIYDRLNIAPYWWLVEVLPLKRRMHGEDDDHKWEKTWALTSLWRRRQRFNLGGGRFIPRQKQDGLNVHRSVKIRLEAGTAVQGKQYVPKAMWDVEPNWVD